MVDIIRTVTIKGVSQGLKPLAADVREVAKAQAELAGASQTTATVTDLSSRRTLSVQRAYDAMRGSLESTFRAQQQFDIGQRKVNMALEQGLITGSEQTRMLGLLQARYDSVAASAAKMAAATKAAASSSMIGCMGEVGGPALANQIASEDMIARMSGQMGKLGQQTKLTSFEVTNLGMQFNDIAVMIASGQNPMVMMMQQGMQIAQILMMSTVAAKGLKATLVDLGLALKLFLSNPFFLAVIAITAAVGAIWLFARSFKSAVMPLKDAVEAHKQSVDNLTKSYKDAADSVLSFGKQSTEVLRLLERQAAETLDKSFTQQVEATLTQMSRQLATSLKEGLSGPEFETIFTSFEALRNSTDRSAADILEFRELLTSISKQNPANELIQKITKSMLELSNALVDVQRQLSGLDQLEKFFDDLSGVIDAAKGKLDEWNSSAASFRSEIQSLYALTIEERVAATAARARASAMPGGIDQLEEMEIARAAALERATAEKEVNDALRDRMFAMQGNLAAAQNEFAQLGQTIGQQTRLRVEYELMQAAIEDAREHGGIVSDEEVAAIKEAASVMGSVATAAAQATLQFDTMFKIAQMARSETDRAVAEILHGTGLAMDDPSEPIVRYAVELERTVAIMDDARGTAKSFFGELIRGGDALAVLSDKLMDLGLNMLISGLMGPAGTTGSGPLGSILQSILGPGAAPAMPEMANVASMQIQAATVILNTAAPIPFTTGTGAPAFTGLVPQAGALLSQGSAPAGASVASTSLPTAPSGSSALAAEITKTAASLGISPHDLATVISYETGGTFSPSIMGGAGGKHMGLIQFGPTEAATYGASASQTAVQQMASVEAYLRNRGLQPGMGLKDVYSTINAGRPGLYNASDAANGGAWGTVSDKVNYQMSGHQANASALLGLVPSSPTMLAAVPPPATQLDILPGQLAADMFPAPIDVESITATNEALAGLGDSIAGLEGPINSAVPGLSSLASSIMNIVPGIGTPASPDVFSAITSGFGGFFAEGGTLGAGKWGIAGESGPEVIHGPAGITPMQRGGTSPKFNVNIKTQEGVTARVTRAEESGNGDFDMEIFAEAIERNVRDKYGLRQTPSRWGRAV